ncbi:MAG: hypothetical protein GY754_09765 [bacterium]|nr:hypothetical protein [bacterium]
MPQTQENTLTKIPKKASEFFQVSMDQGEREPGDDNQRDIIVSSYGWGIG